MQRKTFAAVLLLAVLALLPPGKAVAGPPEGVSGKMVLDAVGRGLDLYEREIDPKRRVRWLEALARTRDPRVAIVLIEALHDDSPKVAMWAKCAIWREYLAEKDHNPVFPGQVPDFAGDVQSWWLANEADLRRRAKQLPQ